MIKKIHFFVTIIILLLLIPMEFVGQTLPVGTPVLSEFYRRQQLLGNINLNSSFTSRPLFPVEAFGITDPYDPDSTLVHNKILDFDGRVSFLKKKGYVQLLPVIWKYQFNSQHPDGYNDGAMVPAKGYQTLFSVGIYAQYGPLSIQLQPEFLDVMNKPFQGFEQIYAEPSPPKGIDLPERFGNMDFQQSFWGQSSIRLTFGPVSLGFSNENLWWGPGVRNALLMTNNAPGFRHVTINTVRPVKTPIGSFEGQLIGGRLNGSGYTAGLPDDWRYLNAITLSYNPKWTPGLFLGLARSFQIYHSDMGPHFYDYLPVFGSIAKAAVGNATTDARRQDQLISAFLRWVWVRAHGEIYVEYGREDHAWNTRDLLLEPNHSAAYVVGIMKLFPLSRGKGEYIQVNAEVTNLASPSTTVNRDRDYKEPIGYWYTNGSVRHGYTNDGQVLGAGIGPGSNTQWLRVSWVKGLKSLGLEMERFVHNNDYFIANIKDIRRNWVDFSTAIVARWDYKNLLFSAQVKYIHEINYEWRYRSAYIFNSQPSFWSPTKDTYNFHAVLNVMYRF